MSVNEVDWDELARQHWEAQPHPLNPDVTIGDFPIAVRLATAVKGHLGHADPQEAGDFWQAYQPLRQQGIGPEDFLDRLKTLAQTSYVFHGRPPTMKEIGSLPIDQPDKVRAYYANLPDQDYPHVPAGEMVNKLYAANQYAQMALQRKPTKQEAAFFYSGAMGPSAILQHYTMLAQQRQSQEGGLWTPQPGGFGAPPPSEPEPNPLPPLGPWAPQPGGFGARKGGNQESDTGERNSQEGGLWTPQPGGFGAPPPAPEPAPNPLPPLGPWQPEPGTFGGRRGGNQE